MARVTRTVDPGERNKRLNSTFQPSEEGRSVQRPKHCDKHGDRDEDHSLKNVNNEHSTVSSYVRSNLFSKVTPPMAQSTGAEEYSDCMSADG